MFLTLYILEGIRTKTTIIFFLNEKNKKKKKKRANKHKQRIRLKVFKIVTGRILSKGTLCRLEEIQKGPHSLK